jgi:hypothetical protein
MMEGCYVFGKGVTVNLAFTVFNQEEFHDATGNPAHKN